MSFIDAILRVRKSTAALAASNNPILLDGEIGHTPDGTPALKIGDGTTAWLSLPNLLGGGGGGGVSDGDKGDITVSGGGANWVLDAAIKAALRDRTLHTGVQPVSTLSDLTATLDARRYRHDQVASSATWTINHNFGFRPQCEVFSPGWVQIEAAILHVTDNQTTITFNTAQTGQAIFT